MRNVIQRFDRCDGAAPGPTGAHPARDFDEAKALALEHDQRFNLRVLKRKTAREQCECGAIHADETGSGIADGPPENGPQNGSEEMDAHRPHETGLSLSSVDESRSDHHFALLALQGFEHLGNIA